MFIPYLGDIYDPILTNAHMFQMGFQWNTTNYRSSSQSSFSGGWDKLVYLHRKFTNVDPEKGPFQKEIYKSSEPITLIFRGYVSFLGGSKYIFDSQIKVARKEGDSRIDRNPKMEKINTTTFHPFGEIKPGVSTRTQNQRIHQIHPENSPVN